MLELGTRVRIILRGGASFGRYGVIDRIIHVDNQPDQYRVTEPHMRRYLGYWTASHLTPTTEGKPPVSDETRAIGRDLLLGHRKEHAR